MFHLWSSSSSVELNMKKNNLSFSGQKFKTFCPSGDENTNASLAGKNLESTNNGIFQDENFEYLNY